MIPLILSGAEYTHADDVAQGANKSLRAYTYDRFNDFFLFHSVGMGGSLIYLAMTF
jgi:hypothetical protein